MSDLSVDLRQGYGWSGESRLRRVRSAFLLGFAAKRFILLIAFFALTNLTQAAPEVDSALARAWTLNERGDYSAAVQIWLPLAQSGNASAQVSLGGAYDYGRGVPHDAMQAIKWYRAAAEQGHGGAQFNLALMYALGEGVARNIETAATWYKKSAEQGLAIAEFNLGMLYVEGDGIARNAEEGIQWLRRAAVQNHPGAQYNLGMIYGMGKGVERDVNEAAQWLSKAATAYIAQSKLNDARDAYQALLRYDPAHASLVDLKARLGDLPAMRDASLASDSVPVSLGTGWPVAGAYVVTNHHVVAGSEQITLMTVHGDEIQAVVVMSDAENDIALLKVIDGKALPRSLPLAKTGARLGSSVFTIGFPRIDVMGKAPKLANGIISGESGYQDNPRTFQISVPIQSGNSGGPLLNMKGEVVGIVTSMLGTTSTGKASDAMPMGAVNYAVKVAYLENMLHTLANGTVALSELPAQDGDLANLASLIQDSVLIVMAK